MANGVYDPLTYVHPRTLAEAWPDRHDEGVSNWSTPKMPWFLREKYFHIFATVLVIFVGSNLLYHFT